MWVGTLEKFKEVDGFLTELPANSVNWGDIIQYTNGGADVVSSRGSHRVFDISQRGTGDDVGDLIDYQQGLYGPGLFYFALGHAMRRNLFCPNWAAPRLIEVEANGWPDLFDSAGVSVPGVFSDTPANAYSHPPRSVTYPVTNVNVPKRRQVIPIPPTKTLYIGWTGSATNGGVVRVRPVLASGAYAATVDLTPIAATSATRMNASFAGSAYVAVEVYITESAANANATVTITSLQAQEWNTGQSPAPVQTGSFKPGRGWSGFKFVGSASQSIKADTERGRENISTAVTVAEVGQWQPLS